MYREFLRACDWIDAFPISDFMVALGIASLIILALLLVLHRALDKLS